jgi:hypothetical protein
VLLTKALFALSDFLAWIGGSLSLLGAIIFAFIGQAYGRMEHVPIGPLQVAIVVAICLVAAAGFLLILKRRPIGLTLAVMPALAYLAQGFCLRAAAYGVTLLLITGTPFLLALLESRAVVPKGIRGDRDHSSVA